MGEAWDGGEGTRSTPHAVRFSEDAANTVAKAMNASQKGKGSYTRVDFTVEGPFEAE
jgi:hypothetical protein